MQGDKEVNTNSWCVCGDREWLDHIGTRQRNHKQDHLMVINTFQYMIKSYIFKFHNHRQTQSS